MKKSLIIAFVFTLILLAFSACIWLNSNSDSGANSNADKQTATYSPLKTPEKIEGLYIGTCQELFKDMRKNDKKTTDEELYRAAAVILFSDKRDEEAKTCCDNIEDESLKKECRRE